MINATYFGEITDLDSRAVWYSDEEDEDDDDGGDEELMDGLAFKPRAKPVEALNHDTLRSNVQLNFRLTVAPDTNLTFDTCVISLLPASQFKNFRISPQEANPPVLVGYFDTVGKAFAYSNVTAGRAENLLWLTFDASNQWIAGKEVGYFVEKLRAILQKEITLNRATPILILSQQYSSSEQLEHLSNFSTQAAPLPFDGRPLQPPSLISNQFESALFEQLTLALRPAVIICLPDPKNFWFDRNARWPSVPTQIIESRVNYDNLEKTLIFT